jgi:alpha-mannosidase
MLKFVSAFAALFALSDATLTLDTEIDHTVHHHSLKSARNSKLTVHMVHHSHDDVGWLKTVDEYFLGQS